MSKSSSSGRDATRPKGLAPYPKRPDDYGHQGSPRSPDKFSTVGGTLTVKGKGAGATRSYSQAEDEYSRQTVSTSASVRHDRYNGPGRSEATGGNPSPRSRAPRSYRDHEGVA
jgi:hypothetical protein